MGKVLLLGFLAGLLLGCMTANNVKTLTESGEEQAEYNEDLTRLIIESERLNQTFRKKGMLFNGVEANQYLNDMAAELVPDFHDDRIRVKIYIVKNATPNAMALPNGDIYVFSGLFAMLNNESQLASIVAHEIGHVIHQHGLKSAIAARNTIVAAHIADIFLFGTHLSYLPAGMSLASFSREQEREADEVSLSYMANTQYDLNQSPEVFALFSSLPKSNSVSGSIYSSHPDNEERIEYLSRIISENYSGDDAGFHESSARFEKTRAQLMELNVKLRLRSKQYQMALDLLQEADAYYEEKTLITFYRGEAYRLMAENPAAAAKEEAWLQERKVTEEDKKKHKDKVAANWDLAKQYYLEILDLEKAPAETHRGLALVYMNEEDKDSAIKHLEIYVNSEGIKDRLYYTHLLEELI